MSLQKKINLAAILTALTIILACGAGAAQGAPAAAPGSAGGLPGITAAMQSEQFWTGKLADNNRLIMDRNEIAAFNKEIRRQSPSIVFDLTAYPQTLAKDALAAMLLKAKIPAARTYSGGVPVASSFYETLRAQMNLDGLQKTVTVRYAFAVTRTNIRTFPTARSVFDRPADREFDLFQETIVDPAEPLLILHQSRDGRWYYVQTRNYRGWIAAGDTAVAADRATWLSYVASPHFLVVTGRNLTVETGTAAKAAFFEMGARIPAVESADPRGYVIELPTRGSDGQAVFAQAAVPADADVSVGYLPFTRENILRQALKLKDTRYGWGGLYSGVDCSAFVMDVYRTFGIMLPRNAGQQLATAGQGLRLRDLPPAAKREMIRSLQPGTALFTAGHVVLYLGEDQGRQYIIHALPAYRDAAAGKVDVMRVIVSDVELVCTDGKTLLESIIGSKQFESN